MKPGCFEPQLTRRWPCAWRREVNTDRASPREGRRPPCPFVRPFARSSSSVLSSCNAEARFRAQPSPRSSNRQGPRPTVEQRLPRPLARVSESGRASRVNAGYRDSLSRFAQRERSRSRRLRADPGTITPLEKPARPAQFCSSSGRMTEGAPHQRQLTNKKAGIRHSFSFAVFARRCIALAGRPYMPGRAGPCTSAPIFGHFDGLEAAAVPGTPFAGSPSSKARERCVGFNSWCLGQER